MRGESDAHIEMSTYALDGGAESLDIVNPHLRDCASNATLIEHRFCLLISSLAVATTAAAVDGEFHAIITKRSEQLAVIITRGPVTQLQAANDNDKEKDMSDSV